MRYVMAAVAVITCPCHLPILLLALAGTGFGAALKDHLGLAVIAFTLVFVVSAWAALRLFTREGSGSDGARGKR